MPLKIYGKAASYPCVIGVAAGKGGVGKSSLTALLGLALASQKYKVGILDADLYGPSIRKMLPEERMPEQRGQKWIPAISQGIFYISMAFFRKEGQASVVRAPIANGLINQFLQQVEWGELDFLLIDFPPGTGDIQITLAQQAHLTGAVLVTTPQEVALMDVRKCLHMFKQVNIPLVGIVENMSYYQKDQSEEKVYLFGKGGGRKLASECGAPLLGAIPIDARLCEALDRGASFNSLPQQLQDLFIKLADQVHVQIEAIKMEQSAQVKSFDLLWKSDLKQDHLENEGSVRGAAASGNTQRAFIASIWQKDRDAFAIRWTDGMETSYQLKELQERCPCAGCVDEMTGVRKAIAPSISKEVGAHRIFSVGRYAIRIEFSSGCSHGIYDFALLRSLRGLKP
jgi:ATP-binding protein involved in chromosome partitioning